MRHLAGIQYSLNSSSLKEQLSFQLSSACFTTHCRVQEGLMELRASAALLKILPQQRIIYLCWTFTGLEFLLLCLKAYLYLVLTINTCLWITDWMNILWSWFSQQQELIALPIGSYKKNFCAFPIIWGIFEKLQRNSLCDGVLFCILQTDSSDYTL